MGYFNSRHINKFLIGQTIAEIHTYAKGTRIWFESGESLLVKQWSDGIVTTPFDKDGEIKQSTVILADKETQ